MTAIGIGVYDVAMRFAPLFACSIAALSGCLERKETITVEPDGTVTIVATFNADSEGELYDGDAVPSLAAGWFVEESVERNDQENETRYLLEAEALFPPDMELPENYAIPGEAAAGVYLQFPTTLLIDERRDGVYYHFRRVYGTRSWAKIETLRELLINERTKDLRDKKPEEMTVDDHKLILRSQADFEVAKLLSFARDVFLEVTPDAPQDGWLQVHAVITALAAEIDYERVMKLAEIEDDEERAKAIADEIAGWQESAKKRLQEALREFCGYGGRQMSSFLVRFEDYLRDFEISEDLGDDTFEITVALPGAIVGSNADQVSASSAQWRFSGRRMRDRDVELMATSRLEP